MHLGNEIKCISILINWNERGRRKDKYIHKLWLANNKCII